MCALVWRMLRVDVYGKGAAAAHGSSAGLAPACTPATAPFAPATPPPSHASHTPLAALRLALPLQAR